MVQEKISIDALIFGGGIAGLWLLDELRRLGRRALLVETRALGSMQTVASQGIIHGGLKYMFDGNLTAPAKAISEMPPLWRRCLAGEQEPNLSDVQVLSDGCYIWGTGSIKSRIFMAGSTIALRAAPVPVERSDWPAALKGISGKVLLVPEQVLDPPSLMSCFARRNQGRILHADERSIAFEGRTGGGIQAVRFAAASNSAQVIELHPTAVIFSAGEGNEKLRALAGLPGGAMQRRPLHMVMARGNLPELFGHCVGGPKPRITITTNTDSAGRRVWLLGGLVAEDGVKLDPPQLVEHAARELEVCVPELDISQVEFATYRVDRAEAATGTGQRPDDVHLVQEANVITAWPTKLALAPRLAERIVSSLPAGGSAERGSGVAPAPHGVQAVTQAPIPHLSEFSIHNSESTSLPPWETATWFAAR